MLSVFLIQFEKNADSDFNFLTLTQTNIKERKLLHWLCVWYSLNVSQIKLGDLQTIVKSISNAVYLNTLLREGSLSDIFW